MKRLPLSFYLQVLLCSAIWGSAFPVIKLSYQELALNSYGEQLVFAGSRFLLAGGLVACVCRRSLIKTLIAAPKGQLALVTLGQTFFQYVFFYYALGISSGTLGALLVSSGSLWWILMAPVFLKTPWPSRAEWVILSLCVVGISIAVYAPGAGSGDVLVGTLCFLLATASGAVGAIGMKQIAAYGSRTITAWSLFLGGGLLLLCGAGAWGSYWEKANWVTFWVTLYLALASAVGFSVWNRLIERYSVNLLSTFRFLIPLCGIIESTIFIPSESLGVGIVVGGTIVILSLVAMSRVKRS